MRSLKHRLLPTKLLLPLFSTLALLTLNACTCGIKTTVDVPDPTLYYLKQASQEEWATEFHFLTTDTKQVTKDQWDTMSQGMVCQTIEDWDSINKMTSAFCSANAIDCNYQLPNGQTVRDTLNQFFGQLTAMSGHEFAVY